MGEGSCIELSFTGDDHSIARKARGERGGREEPGGWKACSTWSCGGVRDRIKTTVSGL